MFQSLEEFNKNKDCAASEYRNENGKIENKQIKMIQTESKYQVVIYCEMFCHL